MTKQDYNILSLIKEKIHELDPNAELILYGSRARGDHLHDSDWDLLLLVDYDVNYSVHRKFHDVIFEFELEYAQIFSLQVYSKEDWNKRKSYTPLFLNIQKDGIRI